MARTSALFGDQQLIAAAAQAPAGELTHFDALDIDEHGLAPWQDRTGGSDRWDAQGFARAPA